MNMQVLKRFILVTLTSIVSAAILTACGGGGSSTGSGVSAGSASISGNVSSGVASIQSNTPVEILFARMLSLAISEAHASGVQGAVVKLVDSSGNVVATQTTDARGYYEFNGLAPGSYTLRVSYGGQESSSPPIQLSANTRTRLELTMNGGITKVEVEAEQGRIYGEVEDDVSHDDDDDSEDSRSEDEDSEDDDSEDDNSEDDDSEDDDDCERESSAERCDDD